MHIIHVQCTRNLIPDRVRSIYTIRFRSYQSVSISSLVIESVVYINIYIYLFIFNVPTFVSKLDYYSMNKFINIFLVDNIVSCLGVF